MKDTYEKIEIEIKEIKKEEEHKLPTFMREKIEREQQEKEREQEVGFGEAEVRKFTRRVRELVITRGSSGPLSEEEAYSEADIKAALLKIF